jgi:flagellar biosynthesis component FlhA
VPSETSTPGTAASSKPPAIGVLLTLEPKLLSALREAEGQLFEAVREAASRGLERLAQLLGVPGTVALKMGELDPRPTSGGQWLGLAVNGTGCPYPDEALDFVQAYVTDQPVTPQPKGQTLSQALQAGCAARFQQQRDAVVAFLRLACVDIASRQPGCLLAPESLRAYLAGLANAESIEARFGSNLEALSSLLRQVLDLGISIADTATISRILSAPSRATEAAIFEDLVEALRPDVIEIRLRGEYLARLRRFEPDEENSLFPFLREGMFQELGAIYPVFQIVVDDDLKDQYFRLRINDVTCTPLRGLGPDELFVNDTAERLEKYSARAAMNPATWQPGSITAPQHQAELEGAGLTTWTPWGYLILGVAAALRQRGREYVHRPLVRYRLDRLAEACPTLVQQLMRRRTLDELTYILRGLAEEQIPARDLRTICERLLDLDYDAFESSRYAILGERVSLLDVGRADRAPRKPTPAGLLRFVRAGLKPQLSHKIARGTSTVVAFLLDEPFERMLLTASSGELTAVQREQALCALRAKWRTLPPTAQRPCVLTFAEVRPILRSITKVALPHLAIISYDDLSASMNIQPIDRISLGGP